MLPDLLKKMTRNLPARTCKLVLPFILVPLFFVACQDNSIYHRYETVNQTGWNKDSAIVFNVQIDDTLQYYDLLLNVRNGGEYPYQNLWLFLSRIGPDSVVLNDTIECYLADQRGKWKGSGVGSVYEISVLCQQNTTFSRKGNYVYKIRQGMREDELKGLSDIGLMINKH